MRALVLTAFGGPEQFELRELPIPSPEAGCVLVKIHAASVNQIDVKIREGLPIGPELPAVLGCDLAGVVVEAGPGVLDFLPGDEVWGCAGGVKGVGGTLAEYMVADARLLAHKPKSLSMREAAALPLVGITAWEALERCQLSQKDHVLIHGGTGGVGHVAVQLAKAKGARVATTVQSAEAGEVAKALGADEVVNFMEENVDAYVSRLTDGSGFDVVFDTVGGRNLPTSLKAMAYEGRLVTTNSRITEDLGPLHAKALSLHVVFMLLPMLRDVGRERHGRIMSALASMVDLGKVRPLMDPERFTLDSAADAYRRLESGRTLGKVVVDISHTAR